MNKPTKLSFAFFVTLLAITVGYLFNPVAVTKTTSDPDLRPAFALPDLEQQIRHIDEWNNQVLIVNFWATWCPPCRKEMPAFNQLYSNYKDKGFAIVGIAIDTVDSVQNFVDLMDIQYPVLTAEESGIQLAKDFGNDLGGLPYSVIIDRQGRIIQSVRGEMSYEEAESLIQPLL